MCGRYLFTTDAEDREVQRLVETLDQGEEASFQGGEIFPTMTAPVLLPRAERMAVQLVAWGFPNFKSKGVFINARSETVTQRSLFRDSFLHTRCAVPTTGFYEWKKTDGKDKKDKYLFTLPGSGVVWLAGLWREFGGERRFVILTTEANESMRAVHNRMPVILGRDELEEWTRNLSAAEHILGRTMPELEKRGV